LTLLARDPERLAPRFAQAAAAGAIEVSIGDARSFEYSGRPDVVINAASASVGRAHEAAEVFGTSVAGTRHVLDFAKRSGPIPVLFTSSGAVYGKQPAELPRLAETTASGPDPLDPRFTYHEAKRAAELLHVIESLDSALQPKIARLFAFVGHLLPLDAHFAIGNFIRDAVRGGPIVVEGDGTPLRSYLYATDMTIWLWRILHGGQANRAYNVGSERAISIADTARSVASLAGLGPNGVEVRLQPHKAPQQRYVPSTERAHNELGLAQSVDFHDAILRTLDFARARLSY
jgi:dTDP-glucose 4,6-dehydratase